MQETNYNSLANATAQQNATQTVTYTYDAYGSRIRETVTVGSTTTYDYLAYAGGSGQALLEFSATSGLATSTPVLTDEYLVGLGQVFADDEVAASNRAGQTTYPGGQPSPNASPGAVWILANQLGTACDLAFYSVITGGPWLMTHRVFDSFGSMESSTPGASHAGYTVGTNVAYAGMFVDPNTGLQDDSARWYDANVGQFVSPDPSGSAGSGTNLYAYCGNEPTIARDPTGLQTEYSGSNSSTFSASIPTAGTDFGQLLDPPHLILSGDGPGSSFDSTPPSMSYEDLSQVGLPSLQGDLFPQPQPVAQTPSNSFMPISVNQNSDWPGLAEINEQRRYDNVLAAQRDQIIQDQKEFNEFNRTGNVTASGPVEAFAKSVVFGAANVSRVVTEPLLIATDTATILGTAAYNSQSGSPPVELPIFSMSYQSCEQRMAAGESYASVAWSGARTRRSTRLRSGRTGPRKARGTTCKPEARKRCRPQRAGN